MTENLPARRRRVTEDAAAGLGFSQPRHVQRMSGRFNLIDETGAVTPMGTFDQKVGAYVDVIIIDANPRKCKIYYPPGSYDGSKGTPPLCWSDNGMGPSVQAREPQAPTCARCPQNVVGSALGLNGAKVTACRDKKKLAVVVNGYKGSWLFDVPAASLGKFRDYINDVVKQKHPNGDGQCDVSDVITRVFYQQGENNKIDFRVIGFVPAQLDDYLDSLVGDETAVMIGLTDRPMSPEAFQQYQITQKDQAQVEADFTPQAPMPVPPEAQQFGLSFPPGPWFERVTAAQSHTATAWKGETATIPVSLPPPQTAPATTPKPRGRPKKAAEPEEIPAFLKREQETAKATPQFGIAEGSPPSDQMQAAVDKAFNIPTD